jgi:hypothetical protein
MDDEIEVANITGIETAFAGHAGSQTVDVWLNREIGPTLSLNLTLDVALELQDKLNSVIEVLKHRTKS